ncbi:hypothetical protein HAX54_031325 [Datura stramonium]|uniref:Uncharacterized protein n=1 Tax=Datura stramonium TaxID=4076 RepID=A0ABS8V917_DATST|nr:hypothetical protein [Datura stramonium]
MARADDSNAPLVSAFLKAPLFFKRIHGMSSPGVLDLKGHQQAATECEQSQGDGINSIEIGFFMTAEVTERNIGLIQYRIPNIRRRLMVGSAFFENKDSGKRMLIKNRRLMPTPFAVATTLLHPDKVTRTGGIIEI